MSEASNPEVRLERRRDALWVWINRPARRNAITAAVLAGIESAVQSSADDPGLRAIVLTGTGDKAFCAGADLTEGTAAFQPRLQHSTTDFGRLARVVRACGIPIIARVNGACVAGGMGLLAMCDLGVAADHARFGLPEVKVGVFPMQVLVFLRAMMHARHLNELCLTGELIGAARAAEMGLVNEIVPLTDLDARVDALVERVRAGSPSAIRRGKQVLARMQMMRFEQALAFAEAQIALAASSTDAEEGLRAFNEKRQPRWLKPPDE
jgi:enoyl-CoA hydratase/carnithine racemase